MQCVKFGGDTTFPFPILSHIFAEAKKFLPFLENLGIRLGTHFFGLFCSFSLATLTGMEETESNFECIPLLEYNEETKLHSLNPNGLAVFRECISYGTAVISVIGRFRMGKSYLMNRLAHGLCKRSEKAMMEGMERKHYYEPSWNRLMPSVRQVAQKRVAPCSFPVGHTQNSTTHGINIYRLPIPFKSDRCFDTCAIILDTEGLTAPERSKDYDQKLYALTMMLSSVLVFNAGPTFDRDSISLLAMASDVMNKMVHQSGNEQEAKKLEPSMFMPSLHWVMRDVPENLGFCNPADPSQTWSPTEQLHHSLKMFDANSLSNLFQSSKCFPLSKPTNNARLLSNLELMHDDLISQQFVAQCDALIESITEQCVNHPKTIEGQRIYPDQIVEMLESFVKQLNQSPSAVPILSAHWKSQVRNDSYSWRWSACSAFVDDTAHLREIFPQILTCANGDQQLALIKSDSVKSFPVQDMTMSIVLDPLLLQAQLEHVLDFAMEFLQDEPKSVYIETSLSKRIANFCKLQVDAMLAVTRKHFGRHFKALINSMPFPGDINPLNTRHTMETIQSLWSDSLLSCIKQSKHFGKEMSQLEDSPILDQHAVHSWQDLTPKTISILWFGEYQREMLPLLNLFAQSTKKDAHQDDSVMDTAPCSDSAMDAAKGDSMANAIKKSDSSMDITVPMPMNADYSIDTNTAADNGAYPVQIKPKLFLKIKYPARV